MFRRDQFDAIEIPMPSAGMNQNISHDLLPATSTLYLDNIIPEPLGKGRVRYGTKALPIAGNNPIALDGEIIEVFPYIKSDQTKQLLLYVLEHVKDDSFTIVSNTQSSIVFNSPTHKAKYIQGTSIKIVYTHNATLKTIKTAIKSVSVVGDTVTVGFDTNNLPSEAITFIDAQTGTFYQQAKVFLYDYSTQAITEIAAGLAAHTVARSVLFKGYLLLCNGVNEVKRWDGVNLTDQHDRFGVTDARSFTRNAATISN